MNVNERDSVTGVWTCLQRCRVSRVELWIQHMKHNATDTLPSHTWKTKMADGRYLAEILKHWYLIRLAFIYSILNREQVQVRRFCFDRNKSNMATDYYIGIYFYHCLVRAFGVRRTYKRENVHPFSGRCFFPLRTALYVIQQNKFIYVTLIKVLGNSLSQHGPYFILPCRLGLKNTSTVPLKSGMTPSQGVSWLWH